MVLNCNLWGVVVRLIRKYLNRFVPVICVLAILVSCLAAPAAASDFELDSSSGLLYYDLLITDKFFFSPISAANVYTPFNSFSSSDAVKSIELTWDPMVVSNINKVVFAVSASQKPSSVAFNGSAATYDSYINYSTGNDLYFYSVSYTGTTDQTLSMTFNFSNVYSGSFGIISCVGLLDVAQSISTVDIYREDIYIVTEGYEFDEADPITNRKLPYVFSKFADEDGYQRSNFRFVVDTDDFVSHLVDNVSFLFTTCCNTVYPTVTLLSKDSNGSDVNNLKVNLTEISEWGTSGDYFQGYGEFSAYKTYQVDVNLSGYDMSKYDLLMSLGVETITETHGWDPCYLDLSLRSVVYVPYIADTPWYVTFFSPLFGGLIDLTASIRVSVNRIYTAITDTISRTLDSIKNNISNFFSSFTDYFDELFLRLEEYFGDDGKLSQAGDQMSEQAGQMNDASGSLNSVEKPTLNSSDLFTGMLDFDTAGLAILSCMTSNVYVTQVLIVVFTCALTGYVFFGKRR